MADDVQRVVMDAERQTLIKRHGLRKWVEKGEAWPAEKWNGVVEKTRNLFVEAGLQSQADDAEAVIVAVGGLVVQSQTFIDYILEKSKWYPQDDDEWRAIAGAVAGILVQRYYREMQAT